MKALRRVAFPFWLAGSRLRRRRGSLLLVVLGLAAATAMLAAVLAGTTAAEDREVGRQVAQIPAKVRAVRVNWFSVGGQVAPYSALDRNVRRELRHALPEHATGTALYSESQLGGSGTLVGLGAVDDLGSWVRLRSGRVPHVCRPDRCEVLVIRSGGRLPNVPGLRLVPVGEGDLETAALFGDAVPAEGLNQSTFVQHIARYHRPAPPPLVLANGVAVDTYGPPQPGLGFGLDFAVVMDPVAAKTPEPRGSFYWGGAFGTWFWLDPVNDLVSIGMIQNVNGSNPTGGSPQVRPLSRKLVYQALVDPKK